MSEHYEENEALERAEDEVQDFHEEMADLRKDIDPVLRAAWELIKSWGKVPGNDEQAALYNAHQNSTEAQRVKRDMEKTEGKERRKKTIILMIYPRKNLKK